MRLDRFSCAIRLIFLTHFPLISDFYMLKGVKTLCFLALFHYFYLTLQRTIVPIKDEYTPHWWRRIHW